MEHTHKNKLLKFGHCPEVGEGGSGLAQIVWSTFLLKEGIVFFFFLQGYYRGITGVFCVIYLQFIEFSLNKHSIDIWNINTHPGEKCSSGAQIS